MGKREGAGKRDGVGVTETGSTSGSILCSVFSCEGVTHERVGVRGVRVLFTMEADHGCEALEDVVDGEDEEAVGRGHHARQGHHGLGSALPL